MARHQARRRLWWNKKKTNQAKLESEVRTKGRTNVFRFSVFCRLKRKKKEFSLSFFSPAVALSQKRATSFLCDACERPSRAPVLLLACNLCIVCLSSMLSVTCLPLFSTYWARLWHLHSIFLCQLAYRFLFENAPFFCCDDRVCLCVTMYDKRSSVFKVTVRAKETCDPGALVLVDVWSNLVMSRTPPYFLCPLFTQQWRSVIWRREKKKKEDTRMCQARTGISFCCPSAWKCTFIAPLWTTSVFGSCPHYATLLLLCRGLGTRGEKDLLLTVIDCRRWCTVLDVRLKPLTELGFVRPELHFLPVCYHRTKFAPSTIAQKCFVPI